MKKGSNFEKFYKGREKSGAAKKEEFRQEKKKEKKEREEKIILAKREKRAKLKSSSSLQPPKYNLEPPGSRYPKKQRDDRDAPAYKREKTSPGARPARVEHKKVQISPKKVTNRTTKPEKWDGPGPDRARHAAPSKTTSQGFYKKEDQKSYSQSKPKSFSGEGKRPFKSAGPKSFGSEERKPFKSEGPKPFRKEEPRAYNTSGLKPFRKEEPRPYNTSGSKSFRKEEPRPYKASGPKPVLQKKELPKKIGHKDQGALQHKQEPEVKAPINRQHLEEELMPLNKYIAHSGVCSRRDAVDLIKGGKVKVNGELVLEPGHKVAVSDDVKVAGRKLNPVKDFIYILLNKPKDYITTTDDPQERKTVLDLLKGAPEVRIYPVGRLDRNTSGVLLLTNDGDLSQKLTHPSNEIKKVYAVTLDKPLTKHHFEEIIKGVPLEDGMAIVDTLAFPEPGDLTQVGIELHSGRNRIVRRIFEHFGYDVKGLDRVIFAGLTKKNVTRGKWRFLTEKEVRDLKFFKKGRK